MTTDTIPEVDEACRIIAQHCLDGTQRFEVIRDAILAYHKRRLAECGGDARLLAMKLWNKAVLDREGEIEDYDPYDIEKITELLQLHTAKAVEEAMRLKEVLAKAYEDKCDEYRNQIATLQQALSTAETVSHGFQEKAGELQKQCEALETALADWHKLADQRSEALIEAQQQCDELRQENLKMKKILCTDATFTCLHHTDKERESYTCGVCLAMERDDLRTRAESAERLLAEMTKGPQ